LIRPFAIGKLTGMGWLYAQEGHIVVQGGWPFPGPSFLVTHTERDVEIQLWRLMVPWIGVDAILHDDDQAVVVCVPRWNRQRLFSLLQANGFTPHARWVWHSTATRRARKLLLHEPATP
jgi:hypothetical protein